MKEQYVIKTNYGAFIDLHNNNKELNFVITDLSNARKYNKAQVQDIHNRFSELWDKYSFEIHKHDRFSKLWDKYSLEDVKTCIEADRVYTNTLRRNFIANDFKFVYNIQTELIDLN